MFRHARLILNNVWQKMRIPACQAYQDHKKGSAAKEEEVSMSKKGLWRGLATFMASITAVSMAAQVTTNNWAARINSMLNTNNITSLLKHSFSCNLYEQVVFSCECWFTGF